MSIARPFSFLVTGLLLIMSAATGIAAQVEGDTWTSPTYGFSVSWAGTDWQPDPDGALIAVGPERLDRVHLLNGVSSLYFEGATRYEGNLSSCVAEEANLLAEESGVSEIRPYRDEDGAQLIADGPSSSLAAFSLALAVGDQEIKLVDYVECRTLLPEEAVLIITLVTEPPIFEEELASAQAIIDTIAQSKQPPLDPLAAYGGWLAAARERPSIAGPLSGEIAFGPDTLGVKRAGVDAPDFYARAEFANPEPVLDIWDFGVGFRDSGGEEQMRLVVDSEGAWFLKDGLGEVIAGGTVVDVDASPTGSNIIELVAVGDTGYFAFNERLVNELDLAAGADGGDIFAGAGFFAEDASATSATAYSGFEIWSLSGLEAQELVEPAIAIDESVFAQLVAMATAAAPLAGPTSGELVQAVGTATVMPAGAETEDFVARADFVNPSDAGDRPWDFGIAFREQENGDHYRLMVLSDGSWEYQIGLQADLSGGTVPSLNYEEGALNTLQIVVAGGSAAFSVNGDFVSQLDTSDLAGAADVWVGTGFRQADVDDGELTRFEDFTVWPLGSDAIPVAPAAATPVAGAAATPVAAALDDGQETALRLDERNASGIDALAVLREDAGETTVTIAARDALGGEIVVVHEGTCGETSTLPAFLLEDLDAAGHSETTIEAPLSDLTDGAHAIAIHRGAEDYGDVMACGDIPGGE